MNSLAIFLEYALSAFELLLMAFPPLGAPFPIHDFQVLPLLKTQFHGYLLLEVLFFVTVRKLLSDEF